MSAAPQERRHLGARDKCSGFTMVLLRIASNVEVRVPKHNLAPATCPPCPELRKLATAERCKGILPSWV